MNTSQKGSEIHDETPKGGETCGFERGTWTHRCVAMGFGVCLNRAKKGTLIKHCRIYGVPQGGQNLRMFPFWELHQPVFKTTNQETERGNARLQNRSISFLAWKTRSLSNWCPLFYPFLVGRFGSPTKIDKREANRAPNYSTLSTGGPRRRISANNPGVEKGINLRRATTWRCFGVIAVLAREGPTCFSHRHTHGFREKMGQLGPKTLQQSGSHKLSL